MPVIGLLVGHALGHAIGTAADYVAAAALFALGVWMLVSEEQDEAGKVSACGADRLVEGLYYELLGMRRRSQLHAGEARPLSGSGLRFTRKTLAVFRPRGDTPERLDQGVSGSTRPVEMGGTGLEPVTPSYASCWRLKLGPVCHGA